MKFLISVLLFLSTSAHAELIGTSKFTRQLTLPLEPLSITCKSIERHGVKIDFDLEEGSFSPRFSRGFEERDLFTVDSDSYQSERECVAAVREIHKRHPRGATLTVTRTIKKYREPGCANERCPNREYEEHSLETTLDGRKLSSNQFE